MRTRTFIALLVGLLGALAPSRAAAAVEDPLRVVVTVPDLAGFVNRIGGDQVQVKSIARGKENMHALRVRPSDLVAVNKADVLFRLGVGMEMMWLPSLLMTARNDRLQLGGGLVDVGAGWEAMNVPPDLVRDRGDVHPQGNPHYNLDPSAGRHMVDRVLEGLVRNRPSKAAYFRARHAELRAEIEVAEARWKRIGEGLRGKKLAVYHMEWNYLARLYGMEIVAAIELKPGIPPTPGHLKRVIDAMESERCEVIVTGAWSNNRQTKEVARKTGARVVELPIMVDGTQGADDWIGMMDVVHARLAAAYGIEIER